MLEFSILQTALKYVKHALGNVFIQECVWSHYLIKLHVKFSDINTFILHSIPLLY